MHNKIVIKFQTYLNFTAINTQLICKAIFMAAFSIQSSQCAWHYNFLYLLFTDWDVSACWVENACLSFSMNRT